MFNTLGSVVVILSALLRGVLCQNCDQNSYLPKGLACSLNVFVRSEGQSDSNLSAPLGSSFLIVNGQDYSTKSRGINLAAFDFMTGRYMTGGVFDVKASSAEGTKLRDFIQDLPNGVIILMAVQGTGNANSNLNDAVASLKSVGVNDTAILDNESFGAVLYKGSDSQPWIKESKNTVGNGPSFVTKSIAIPYGYIPEESIRTPFFNVAGSKIGGYCIQSSSQSDANSMCGKALDGLTTSEWISNSEGVGAWMTIGFASPYKINKVRILQRTLSGAQSKDVRIDFSDCSTFPVTLTQNKNDFQEFTFSPRIASWVKLTVTSTYTASSSGFKEIQFYYDQYQSDTVCEQVIVTSGSTSNAYRLLTSSAAFQVLSQKPIIILSTTSSASGPRYEIILDDPSSNTTYVRRSHDGLAAKQVAVSVARKRVISGSTSVHVWLEWKVGRVVVGMGESVLLYYRDEQPLDVKYMFLQSPSSNAEFKVCARKDDIYESASSYWPLDKVLGGSLLDLNGSKQGTLHGPLETMGAAQTQVTGYNFVATKFDGTSNWADLGDFKDTCVSDMDLCYEGISVAVRVNRQGSGERYIISSGGQHTRGFAIYSLNSTTLRVEIRDSQKRWAVDKYVGSSGHLSIGFSWSMSLGLTVVSYAASVSVERNTVGEVLDSPMDETSRLTLGRPNNEMANYFQGSINNLAIFEYSMTSESLAALFKGTGLSDYTDSCHKDNAVSLSFLYYPGDINPDVLSPSICREKCGNAYYKKALIYEASVCTCTNMTSSLALVPSDFCAVPCTGNAGLKCGGRDSHVHVLDAVKSDTSLVCTNPTTQEALTQFSVTLQISKPFYDLEKNFLEVGDGSYSQKLSSPFKHAFVGVENFTTSAKAALKNNETGHSLIFPCTSSITSFLPTKGLSFSCPPYVPTNTEFKCNMSFIQGYHVDAQVTWTTKGSAIALSLPDSMVVSLGPEYTATSPAVNQTSPGMYVFSESVKNRGTFVGFQLDVAREGYLEIKCLSVVCDDSTQRFCPSQRACISQNSICQVQTISCASGSTLSMSSGRCKKSNSSSSNLLNLPTVASSNFNYNLKSSYQFWVNSGQRNLIALNNTMEVSECDFFGLLIPSVASAASMATSYAFQSTLFYSPAAVTAAGSNNNTFVGLKSPQQANGPQITDNVPNFQFKVIPQGTVTATHTYVSEGTYKAKADFGSNSATILIHAQNVISNLSVISVAAYAIKEMANISLSLHTGTNVSYTWIFNTTNATTSTPWVMYSCPTVGFHLVRIFGSNKVSVSYSRCTVECQERISGLEFTSDGLPTSAEKEQTRLSWSLQNGSNVNFKINPGDGSGVRELNDSKVAGAMFVGTLNVTYSAAGVYNATITACNKIGCVTTSGFITIQEKIVNVSMEAPNCMATNKIVNITAITGHGNMMRYSWTINNKTIKTYEQPWLIYAPSKAGIYNFTLVVYNNVSTGLCTCKLIPAKDPLGNVEIGPVQPAGIGQPLSIPYKVNHGSGFSISVCYGDGVCVDKNGTEDAEGAAVYSGVFTHNYAKDGDYLVNLTVCNCVGCNSTSINVHVETPVRYPKVAVSKSGRLSNLENACSTPLYVLVNQTVFMGLTVGNGTNVKVVWYYGDGLNSSESSVGPFNKDGMHSNHSYIKAGNYTITAKPHNLNGHEVFTCHIVAQEPILGLEVTSNSPVGFPDGSATVTTVTTDPRPSGPIHCVFVYGDTKTSASLPMSFTEKQTTIAHHNYPSKGKFKGSVNCSNAVSYHVKPFEVEVQDKVFGSTIKALGTVSQKKRQWIVGDGYRGKGNQGTIFGRNTDIQFNTKSLIGSNLTCSFCFDCNGSEQVIKNSTCGSIMHRFMASGKKEVEVEVKNDVSSETIKMYLTVDDNIDCVSLVNDGPKIKGEEHIFTTTPNMVGPNWCCYINYGDSSKPEFLVPETSNCTSNLTFPTTLSRFQFKENKIRTNHTYPDVGEYTVTMECGNRVSECRLESKAVMVQIPCKQPEVTIMDFSSNKTSATEKKGSEEIEMRSKNKIDCEASLKRLFTWVIYNTEKSLNIPLNMTGRIDTSKEQLVIPPRSLEVGLYKICFTLNMTEIIGVHGTACCYLRIIPSHIMAEIVGGTEVSVGFNRTRFLDAENSKNPDTELTAANDPQLKCYWFCRREGDNYTMPTSVDPQNLPPVPQPRERPVNGSGNLTDLGGCFGDGPGRLEFNRCVLAISTAKMQENTTYDFTVCVVHDDGRTKCANQKWNIEEGDPPAMAIDCYYNCKEKLNPSSKVSLSCYCVSCTPYTSLSYNWQISRWNVGSSKYEALTEDEVMKIITTPIDGRSFSIGPNVLDGGKKYKFTCKGSRGNKGAQGSASYEKVVNSKPVNGTCDVTPKIGVALNTTFTITCSGWKDEDQPLLYTYGNAHECEGKMIILAPDRGIPSYVVESMMPGPKEKNYTTYVIVHVADKHKAISTSTCIPIKVKEKKLDTKSLGNILNGTVQNLLASGSGNEVNQVMSSILFQVNKQSSSSSSDGGSTPDSGGEEAATKSPAELEKERKERTQIRTHAISVMAQIANTVTNLQDVTQTTKTLEQAISDPKELTSEAKEEAVNAISKLSSAIESKSKSAEPQEVEQAVRAVCEGISNCIDFVAASPVVETTAPTTAGVTETRDNDDDYAPTQKTMSEEQKNMNRKLASTITKTIQGIASLVQNTKRPGEKPTVLITSTMEIELARERNKDLKNKTFSMSGLNLATNPEMFPGEDLGVGKEPAAVDSMILTSSKNIYNFDESAGRVEGGKVATIEFKNSTTQDALVFQNLSTPVEMFIERVPSSYKPNKYTMTKDSLYFIRTSVHYNDSALHVHVYPDRCDYGFYVFIKRGSFPSETNFDYNYTLPHDGQWDLESNCSKLSNYSSAFEIFLSNKDMNYTAAGRYYIGIKIKPGNMTNSLDILPANFTAMFFTSVCMYWDTKNETWKSDGCLVGPKTTPLRMQCLCDHLTSFSTSFIVPPNRIDWDLVKEFDPARAAVCLSTVIVVFCLYLIFLIPARRADRRDAEKTGVSPLPDNDPRDTYCYEIHVHTGFMRGAGSSAEVSVVMNGSVGESDPRVLKDPARKTFRTGGVDAFLMTVPQSLGNVRNIRIWHNNGGSYPSWNLLRVMIQDLQTDKRWWFVCDKWLAVDEGDGKVERILYPATSNELTKFNVLFATEVRKNLTDGHLWFSVVTRPARSTFTRVQRLTCCLSILLCTMLANIIFYNADTSQGPKGSIKFAGFSFSLAQVSIGVMSSLIVFPANLIVVQLFRKARAKETKIKVAPKEGISPNEVDIEVGQEKEEKPKKEGLPHWFVYVAYFLAIGSSFVSGSFVIFYGITYGPEKSLQWLTSMTISFVQDVLISQPIKVFLLASIFALLIKDPNKAESDPLTDANKLSTDEEWLHKNVQDLNKDEKDSFKKLITDRPPDEAKLEIARQLRMKEKHMKSIIRELVWYMFFLLIVLTVSYGNRDPATYHVTKYINDIFLHSRYSGALQFDKVSKINDYWKWMNTTVLPSIYKDRWYNGHQSYPLGFIADTPTDLVLAVARLRQLRIKKDSCTYLPIFQDVIHECNDFYSTNEEDRRSMLPGWKQPPPTNMTNVLGQSTKKTAWDYQTGEDLKTFAYWGYKATYEAGGYVQELPTSFEVNGPKAKALLESLQANNWLDRYTRAIFTELSIYNANMNFFCVITLLYEQLPTGGLFNYPSILTLKLYRYVGGDMIFVLSCEIIYLLFTLYFIFRELKMVMKEGMGYLKNPWSMVEVFVTLLSMSLVVLYFVRIKFTSDSVKVLRMDHDKFVSFHYTAFLDEWINAMMGLIVFLSFLKIVRLLRFNRRMSLLAQTLKVCFPRIFAFLLIYGMAFFAYSQFACLVFGQNMEGFGTILRSAATLMDTILGKFALKEITEANRLIGPTFFYFYTVTMVFILINMFLSIINDSFSEVKNDVNKQSNDYEIVNFMVHRLKENIGKTMGNAIVPIYKEPKSKLEKDCDTIEEHADSIMHYMRNMTFENMRHTRWFEAETSKERKKKMFKILLEVDWDYFEDELADAIPVFEEFLNKHDDQKIEEVHRAYRFKKLREEEMESRFTVRESDNEEEDENSSAGSNCDDSGESDNNSGEDKPSIEYNLLDSSANPKHQNVVPSPAASVRSVYASPNGLKTPILLHSPTPKSPVRASPDLGKAQRVTPVPLANESEMSGVLEDVERTRCVTDAELNSFLPVVKSVDDNNIPKYESDPEHTSKKERKKKKAKKVKPKSAVSLKSKAAWGDDTEQVSRKSPAGSSDKGRVLPKGAENDSMNDFAQDNKGLEDEVLSDSKGQKRREKKKKKELKLTLTDDLDCESME